ncbi:MAG: hypothetical protein RIM72_04190 [Alphaproteobacteria bacterium]
MSTDAYPRLRYSVLLGISLFLYFPLANAADSKSDYYQLIYDFEVAGYCGLLTEDIVRATRDKRQVIEADTSLSDIELKKIRISAFVAADAEYQNRSLGGHKAWCETDGLSGVNRILKK